MSKAHKNGKAVATMTTTATDVVVEDARGRILARSQRQQALVPVSLPDLGMTVYAMPLTARDGIAMEEAQREAIQTGGGGSHAAWLVARSIVHEDRTRVFQDSDVEALLELPVHLFTPLMQAASRVNGVAQEAVAAAKNA